jgi:hypothetical protein
VNEGRSKRKTVKRGKSGIVCARKAKNDERLLAFKKTEAFLT